VEVFNMRAIWLLVVTILIVGVTGCSKPGVKAGHVGAKPEAAPKIGDVKINPKDGAKMVWVPAGEFLMGSTDAQYAAALKGFGTGQIGKFVVDSERPQRKFNGDGYWIYK